MNKKTAAHIVLVCIHTAAPLLYAEKQTVTYIPSHSPSISAARTLAGWENKINIPSNSYYAVCAIIPEVTRSFRADRIAQCILGDTVLERDCNTTFTVSGSRTNRNNHDWLADYFGLPTDFISAVAIAPHIENVLINIDLYAGLDTLMRGLYCSIHIPLVYTRWTLSLQECINQAGTFAHDPGYFNDVGIPRSQLVSQFIAFISGHRVPHADNIFFHPLQHAKMSSETLTQTRIAEIYATLGWNIVCTNQYHLGFNGQCIIPFGTRPRGEFLFEPIIGNGHHLEIGGGISAHWKFWERDTTNERASLYFDANLTHIFTTKQCRSFDLKHTSNSRYMLATKLGTPITNNIRGNSSGAFITPIAQFKQEITTVANLTTGDIHINADVHIDIAGMFVYEKQRWSWLLGYSFWARSCDNIHTVCLPLEPDTWALKGDAQVFGFENSTPIALSASQSKATIHSGKNFPLKGAISSTDITNGKQNPRIDSPLPTVADSNSDGVFTSVTTSPGGSDQINTSIQPHFLNTDDIDINSARTRGLAHKIFGHFSYTCKQRKSYTPYLGFGAEVTFGQRACHISELNNCACLNCIPSYWGIWLKGGCSFG